MFSVWIRLNKEEIQWILKKEYREYFQCTKAKHKTRLFALYYLHFLETVCDMQSTNSLYYIRILSDFSVMCNLAFGIYSKKMRLVKLSVVFMFKMHRKILFFGLASNPAYHL